MEYLIIILLSAFAFYIVIRPFTNSPEEETIKDLNKNLSNLRSSIYQEMELLRLDFELGLIEADQYELQIQQCRIQLASTLIAEKNT